ncbi:MAG TPA: hypothetical protein VNH13_07680 [Candidatus Acidoferrales bacterium]|jgi:hypothetical protein|nr:hypothetical protein [Candidatus Acidoferrales bacterium]
MLSASTRLVVAAVATLVLVGGLVLISYGSEATVTGLWFVVGGAVVLVALAIERNRYRSEEAERSFESTGPGGGEPAGGLDPRFRRSDETFVDPTTGVTMRVFVDRTTGERRYVGEG